MNKKKLISDFLIDQKVPLNLKKEVYLLTSNGSIVWVIGLALGGTTGYAINPARDLGPRIMHSILPVKGSSDWGYAWIPVIAPLTGAVLAALLYLALQ